MGKSDAYSQALIRQYVVLWQDIFGDEPEYVMDVIRRAARPVMIVENNEVMSALLLIPYSLDLGNEVCKAYYIYGLLTNPAYRGMGYAEKLMHKAHAIAKAEGAEYCFLCPANDRLLTYYKYNGYTDNVVDMSHCRPPIDDVDQYNASLPRPAVLHSKAAWGLGQQYGSSGVPRPTQFIALGDRLVPTNIAANCLLE